jgi:hypothetical protein
MNIIYSIIMLALVGLALTAQTATNEHDYNIEFKIGDYHSSSTDS